MATDPGKEVVVRIGVSAGFAVLLMLFARVSGMCAVPWWLVFLPIYAPITIVVGLLILICILALVVEAIGG